MGGMSEPERVKRAAEVIDRDPEEAQAKLQRATGQEVTMGDVMVVPANVPSKVDPLQQYGVAGWKVAFVAKVIDSARVLRVETAVSP